MKRRVGEQWGHKLGVLPRPAEPDLPLVMNLVCRECGCSGTHAASWWVQTRKGHLKPEPSMEGSVLCGDHARVFARRWGIALPGEGRQPAFTGMREER